MKIIATSDLHGHLPNIPDGDLLLICGDFVPLEIQRYSRLCRDWMLQEFTDWVNEQPVNKVLFICGNHEVGLEKCTRFLKDTFPFNNKITYLEDEEYNYKGLRIYGTPWCKIFYNWAFMLNDIGLQSIYSKIPEGLDILMTHDAPYQNEVGFIHDSPYVSRVVDASNYILGDIIEEKKPKLSLCGHIHSGTKELAKIEDTKFVNVSYVDEYYNPINKIFTYDYN